MEPDFKVIICPFAAFHTVYTVLRKQIIHRAGDLTHIPGKMKISRAALS